MLHVIASKNQSEDMKAPQEGTYKVGSTSEWFKQAVPNPTKKNFHVQLGVHFEEVQEMCDSITLNELTFKSLISHIKFKVLRWALGAVGDSLKAGTTQVVKIDAKEMLDSLCDQHVTGVGVGHMLSMDMDAAIHEVDRSNWSKFEDGAPVFLPNGKIGKGMYYTKPYLDPYIPYTVKVLE